MCPAPDRWTVLLGDEDADLSALRQQVVVNGPPPMGNEITACHDYLVGERHRRTKDIIMMASEYSAAGIILAAVLDGGVLPRVVESAGRRCSAWLEAKPWISSKGARHMRIVGRAAS